MTETISRNDQVHVIRDVGAFVGQERNTSWVRGLDKYRTYGGLA